MNKRSECLRQRKSRKVETLCGRLLFEYGKPSEIDFQLEESSTVESDAIGQNLMESEITQS